MPRAIIRITTRMRIGCRGRSGIGIHITGGDRSDFLGRIIRLGVVGKGDERSGRWKVRARVERRRRMRLRSRIRIRIARLGRVRMLTVRNLRNYTMVIDTLSGPGFAVSSLQRRFRDRLRSLHAQFPNHRPSMFDAEHQKTAIPTETHPALAPPHPPHPPSPSPNQEPPPSPPSTHPANANPTTPSARSRIDEKLSKKRGKNQTGRDGG